MKPFITLILCLFAFSCSQAQEELKTYTADGRTISSYNFDEFEKFLQKKNDTTYVINFWATWCRPCVAELPYFFQLEEELKNEKIHFIYVSLDFPTSVESNLIPYLIKKDINAHVVLLDDPDANTWIPKVSGGWQGSIPATVIYNQTGDSFFEQSFNYNSLKREITHFLN